MEVIPFYNRCRFKKHLLFKKNMIGLIIGYGSAGKRHLKVLKSFKKISKIYVLTSQDLTSSKKIIFIKKIKNIYPSIIVISNETHKHVRTLIYLEKKFKKKIIVVEKPLFQNYYKYKFRNNKIFVCYNLRYHPILKFIKQGFKLKDKVFYVEAQTSSYLPHWRKNLDYSKSYSANKKKGGGALLDLSHEIDYIKWLFKDFKIIKIFSKKISNLNITSNDISIVIGRLSSKSLVKIKLTYFNKISKRNLIICYASGKQIYADLLKSTLKIVKKNKVKLVYFKKSSQYLTTKEMYHDIFNKNYKHICSYKEGLNLLRLIKK